MPRYFFDIVDGSEFRDTVGSVWPDLAAARLEAVRYSGEVLREMPDRFWNCDVWTMNVLDHNRTHLFALKFKAEGAPAIDRPHSARPTLAEAFTLSEHALHHRVELR